MSSPLSKSRFLAGLQCAKRLWFETRARELVPAYDEATQAIFAQGQIVGRLAQGLFPGGVEIDRQRLDWSAAIATTRDLLRRRVPLYEAAFEHAGAACRVDLLVPVADSAWDLYEVKSTASVKDVHHQDVALQSYVVRGAGIPLRRAFLAHIDSTYVRGEELDVQKLFKLADLTDAIGELEREVPRRIGEMHELLELGATTPVAIGPHCSDPYDCPLTSLCWKDVPEESVFTLRRGGARSWDLFARGVRALVEIPDEEPLNKGQRLQVEVARERRPHVDPDAIGKFLRSLEHPLHYLDFESFGLAVPRYPGTRPFQQVPFQFSIDVVDGEGEISRSTAFLAEGGRDPRPEFIARLQEEIGPRGSIVAYNAAFERGRLGELANGDARLEAWVAGLDARIVDLLSPFRSLAYYHPDQLGSASLKAVLPILGQRGYEGLEIQDGAFAGREFLRSTLRDTSVTERARIRNALLRYCGRDTEGMVEIVAALRRLAG